MFNVVAGEASGEKHNGLDALKDSDAVSAKDKDVEDADAGAKGPATGNASKKKGATNTRAKRCLA